MRKSHRRERLCFAVPAGIFLLFAALETADTIGFEPAFAETHVSSLQLITCPAAIGQVASSDTWRA
jgi:hypothetical protein